jgi:hypothetical protein
MVLIGWQDIKLKEGRHNYPKHPFIQVQAVLLVLGGCEVPLGLERIAVPTVHDEKVFLISLQQGFMAISSFS